MEVIILLIVQFLAGVIIGGCYVWSVHKRHREAWHDEYRRLMGLISEVEDVLDSAVSGYIKHRNDIKTDTLEPLFARIQQLSRHLGDK